MTKEEKKLYAEFVKRHCDRFNISEEDFYKQRPPPERPVSIEAASNQPFEPHLTLKIDLRYSQNKIFAAVEKQVKHFKAMYEEDFDEYVRDKHAFWAAWEGQEPTGDKKVIKQARKSRMDRRYHGAPREPMLYCQMIEVYDLKCAKAKETQISERLSLSLDTVKNYYKAAKHYIEFGPPFGPPFK